MRVIIAGEPLDGLTGLRRIAAAGPGRHRRARSRGGWGRPRWRRSSGRPTASRSLSRSRGERGLLPGAGPGSMGDRLRNRCFRRRRIEDGASGRLVRARRPSRSPRLSPNASSGGPSPSAAARISDWGAIARATSRPTPRPAPDWPPLDRPDGHAGEPQPRAARAEFRPINLRRVIQPFLGRGRAMVAATLLPALRSGPGAAGCRRATGPGAGPARAGRGPARQDRRRDEGAGPAELGDDLERDRHPASRPRSFEGAARRLGMLDAEGRRSGPPPPGGGCLGRRPLRSGPRPPPAAAAAAGRRGSGSSARRG